MIKKQAENIKLIKIILLSKDIDIEPTIKVKQGKTDIILRTFYDPQKYPRI